MKSHLGYFHNGDKVTDNVCPPKKKLRNVTVENLFPCISLYCSKKKKGLPGDYTHKILLKLF